MDKYYLKLKNEKINPFLNKNFGIEEIVLEDAESVDIVMNEIIKVNNKNAESNQINKITFFMSSEIASFSSDLINKYKLDKNTKIIIIWH